MYLILIMLIRYSSTLLTCLVVHIPIQYMISASAYPAALVE